MNLHLFLTRKHASSNLLDFMQVKKFGDKSKLDIIAAEVGRPFEGSNARAQSQLFDDFVRGCEEAIQNSGFDGKVVNIFDFFFCRHPSSLIVIG